MKSSQSSFSILLAILLLSVTTLMNAQKIPMKFGKIDPAYFEMKSYAKDTAAEALILGDFGESRVVFDPIYGFVVEYTHHFRAKIFKKSGYKWAAGNLFLSNTGMDVLALKGRVYNLEKGAITESDLEKDMIHNEALDKKWTERKFTLPNVKEGSIIEYFVVIKSHSVSVSDWEFQNTIPALWSEYRVSYPEYFHYKTLQKGYLTCDINERTTMPSSFNIGNGTDATRIDYQELRFRWAINEVPAFDEEPYMNSLKNYISCMQFELASFKPPYGMVSNFTQTWEKINEELLEDEDFGLQLNRGGFLKAEAERIKAACHNPDEQIKTAFEFVRNQMKWNSRSWIYVSQSLHKSWEDKAGSAADINMLLVTLLKEIGIDAEPVILSTRSNGMIHPGQMMLGQFNYVIVSAKTNEKTYLLDATEKSCPYNMLAPRCINGEGRVISKTRSGWIDLNSTQRYEYTNIINANIEGDGTIKGKISRLYGNYAALEKRIEITEKKDHEEYIQSLEENYNGLSVNNYIFTDLDSVFKPFKEELEVEVSDASLLAGNILSLSPLLFPQWSANPFKIENRTFPVDFVYPRLYRQIINYQLPEGYLLDEKPDDLVITLPDGKTKFSYRIALRDNTLQVMSVLDIGKSLYTAEEYAFLKQFYGALVDKENQKVVLKKISDKM